MFERRGWCGAPAWVQGCAGLRPGCWPLWKLQGHPGGLLAPFGFSAVSWHGPWGQQNRLQATPCVRTHDMTRSHPSPQRETPLLSQSCWANHHTTGWLRTSLFSHTSGGQKFKVPGLVLSGRSKGESVLCLSSSLVILAILGLPQLVDK